ncbi:hypothetical protein H5410_056658 [Solanum commersonii]|uniref:Putative plant transposon protein domain-containing protein n=1 Tax=Solanum commersonii TaxID=4109 RepID=A0A9J5WMW9_SOLCO|nr:hypothetical protein H5410_056658 [Solanum commersonii]
MVRGKKIGCNSEYINGVLGRDLHFTHPYDGFPVTQFLDDLKGWLVPLIFDTTLRWIEPGAPIEKRDLSIAALFWFVFISNTIMPSQNKSVLCHSKVACLGSIISRRRIDLELLFSQEMAIRAKQRQTSQPCRVLINEVCRRTELPHDAIRDIKVTPTFSTDIWRIEIEYTHEEADGRRAAPADTSPEVDVDSLPTEASSLTPASGPSVEESDAETNDELIVVHDDAVFDDITDLENDMYETARQTSLRDTAIGGSSGAGPS